MKLTLLEGDVFKRLPEIPSESIDLVITSPPYWGLRNYGVEGQLGNEPTMEAYLDNTLRWVKEVWRVLKPTGSFVLNMGDCFVKGRLCSVSSFAYCRIVSETDFVCRGEHIWAKPNVPSPIRSRLKHSHEKLFWFVKDADKYYFDAKAWMKPISFIGTDAEVNEYLKISTVWTDINGFSGSGSKQDKNRVKERNNAYGEDQSTTPGKRGCGMTNTETIEHSWRVVPVGEKQNGFELAGKQVSEHVAPFPATLIRPYVQSLCPHNGTVCDPFLGSGTSMRVAMEEGRNAVGIELSPASVAYTKKRLNWGSGIGVEYKEECDLKCVKNVRKHGTPT